MIASEESSAETDAIAIGSGTVSTTANANDEAVSAWPSVACLDGKEDVTCSCRTGGRILLTSGICSTPKPVTVRLLLAREG